MAENGSKNGGAGDELSGMIGRIKSAYAGYTHNM